MPQAGLAADELSLVAAEQFAKRGQFSEAQAWARRAATYFGSRIKIEPKVTSHRLNCAQAYIMLREFSTTVEVLQIGWKDTKDPMLQRATGQAFGIWLKNSLSMDAVRKLSLLEQGFEWDGQNSLLLQVLLDPETVEVARQVLPSTQPVTGATVRALIMSIADFRANKIDAAKADLQLALNLRPDLSLAVASNAACVWAYDKHADASASLQLAKALMELKPDEVVTQRAYGLVLSRYSDKLESIRLLEEVLLQMPND